MIGGRRFALERPVSVDGGGRAVTIVLPSGALAPGASYFVTIDDGAFFDERGTWYGAVAGSDAWRFSTRAARPTADLLTVAAGGGADFCTVQGAVDAVPSGNTVPVTIAIKNGRYHEIVLIAGKSNIHLIGEDRRRTVIAYANNDKLQAAPGEAARAGQHRRRRRRDRRKPDTSQPHPAGRRRGRSAARRDRRPRHRAPRRPARPPEHAAADRADLRHRILRRGQRRFRRRPGDRVLRALRAEDRRAGRPRRAAAQPAQPPGLRFLRLHVHQRRRHHRQLPGAHRRNAISRQPGRVRLLHAGAAPGPGGLAVTPPDTFTGELRLREYDNRGLDTPFLNRTGDTLRRACSRRAQRTSFATGRTCSAAGIPAR